MAGGTWTLRLREVAGDDLPDTDWQAGTLGVLGWALHTQALLLVWSQDTALQCLWKESVFRDPRPLASWPEGWTSPEAGV